MRSKPAHRRGHTWLQRLACQRGIALPTAAMMLMIVMLLAGAAGAASIGASSQATHDRGTKSALAAADAGLDTALYRLNKLEPGQFQCVVDGPLHLLLDPVLGTGWCPEVTLQVAGGSSGRERLGDGSSFTYRMSAGQNVSVTGMGLQQQRKIVVTGSANGVSRRIMADVSTMTGISAFGGNALTSLEDVSLPIGTEIVGGVASNGNVGVGLCAQIVGNSWYGPDKKFTRGGVEGTCGPLFTRDELPQNLILNPVEDGEARALNHNTRINLGGGDPFTLRFLSNWDADAHVLQLRGSSALTLTGSTYWFCKLEVENLAQLIVAPRLPTQAPLKIFIAAPDDPECAGVSNAGTVRIRNTASISNLNADSDTLQILAVGSPDPAQPTSIRFENAISNLIGTIYAPNSTVLLQHANAVLGAVAAKRVTLEHAARIQWHPSADITLDDLYPLFKRTRWTECTSTAPSGSNPADGC